MSTEGPTDMSDATPSPAELLEQLPRAQLFDADEAEDDRIISQAMRLPPFGARLRLPESIDTETESCLPVLVLRHTHELRDWEVNFDANLALVGVDLETGEVKAKWVFEGEDHPKGNIPSRLGERPDEEFALESTSTDLIRVDARVALRPAWQRSRWAITPLCFDEVYDTATVQLQGPQLPPASPLPRSQVAAADHPAIDPRDESVDPAWSNEPPAALSMSLSSPGERPVAQLSVRMPQPAALIVEPPAKGEDPGEVPAALVPVTLLLVRLDRVEHGHLHLKLPVADSGPIAAGQSTTAHADLDLLEFLGADARHEGTLLYAVAGPNVAGPYRLG